MNLSEHMTMQKKIVYVILIAVLILTAATALGCTDAGSTTASSTIELNEASAAAYYDQTTGAYVFEAGKVDWSAFRFFLYDSENNLLDEITVTESMITPETLALTDAPGTYTVRVVYQGASLYITIRTYVVQETPTYYVTYNAGIGGTFPDAAEGETVTDPDGAVTWTIGYPGGAVTTVETPEREGYVFAGWYVTPDYSGSVFTAGRTVSADTTVYARWSDLRTFTVTFTAYRDGANAGTVASYRDIEYGTSLAFPAPADNAAYEFVNYTVSVRNDENETIDTVVIEEAGAEFEVTNDLVVAVNYTIRMLTVTYVVPREGSAWVEGYTVFENWGEPVTYVRDVTSYGGNPVSGWCYVFTVPYGTTLTADVEPVPEIPSIPGTDGMWIDVSTGRAPLYGSVTADRTFIGQYTDRVYTMYFWLDEEQTEPARDTTGAQITRTASYGATIQSAPAVPARAGHSGVWLLRVNGVLTETDITAVPLTDENGYHAVARYTPNNYTVTYYLSPAGSDAATAIYSYNYAYGTEISPGIDVLDAIEDAGYSFDVYDIEWYSSSGKQPSSAVIFPRTVEGNASFYAEPVRKPYTITFRSPADAPYAAFEETIRVEPDSGGYATVSVPTISIPGYTVTYWYYYDLTGLADIPDYSSSVSYAKGDRVVYNNIVYSARDTVPKGAAYAPPSPTYWSRYVLQETTITGGSFEVSGSHIYDADVRYDSAIYANAVPERFNADFYNVIYTGAADTGYTVSFELQTSVSVAFGGSVTDVPEPKTPQYPDQAVGDFVFDGWYLDPGYVTDVDPASYIVSGYVGFYAKWTDTLAGTEGLRYEAVYDASGTSIVGYKVVGFVSDAEEFSSLTVYIPESHLNSPVISIGANAFADLSKILFITDISLPASLLTIEDNALRGLAFLTNVEIASGGSFVFENGVLYSGDRSVIHLYLPTKTDASYAVPGSVTRIAGGAFANNGYLESVTFAEGSALTALGAYAFDGADALTAVALPASLETIGEYAFRGCLSLGSVTVDSGSRLRSVGTGAFDTVLGALETSGEYITLGTTLIRYTGTASSLTLRSDITAIAAGAFSGYGGYASSVEALTIGADSALANFSSGAFDGAFNISEIRIMNETAKIDAEEGAFDGVSLSAALYVPDALLEEYTGDPGYSGSFDSIQPIQ